MTWQQIKQATEKTGWLVSAGLASVFFLLGQWYILNHNDVILGIYATLTGIIVLYWISWRPKPAVTLWKALILAAVLFTYHWTANWASTNWCMSSNLRVLPFIAGLLLVFAVHSVLRSNQPERLAEEENFRKRFRAIVVWILVILSAMVLIVILAKKYLASYDYSNVINFFFVLRLHGIVGDIPSTPFNTWGRLWAPMMYLVVMIAAYRMIIYRQDQLGIWKSLLIIYVLGNVGGITIAYLSANGLAGLTLQLKSIHYNFYNVAKQYESFQELWAMLGTFATVEIHQFQTFAMSHPPFNIIWNWILIQVTGDQPFLITLIIGAAAWTTVFPVFIIGRELYNREFGYYMAGLYATLPNTLIINHIALDGMITCFLAWAIALVVMGSRREGHGYMLLAGLAVAGIAFTHYSMPIFIPALFIIAIIGLRSQRKPEQGFWAWWKAAIFKTGLFLLGIAIPFLIIGVTTQWKFDYLAMQHYVLYVAYKNHTPLHPWFVGAWLTWVNYFIFVGAGVTALFIVRWQEILKGDWKNDVLPWAGVITMLVPFVLAIIRQETERAFMIFNIFIVATAAVALWKDRRRLRYMLPAAERDQVPEMGGGWRPAFVFILALSFVNAVIIQMLTVDHF